MGKTISKEAAAYLQTLLTAEVHRQVENGEGDRSMPFEWTELHMLVIGSL